jgi:UDP-N-acetylmuramoyl-L-alanyl-D-glutamate--2,6-diaminopimelate ligase
MAEGAGSTVTARADTGEKLSLVVESPILSGTPMKLKDLLPGAGSLDPWPHPDAEIASVVYKSAESAPGSLFVAIRGEKADGNRFVAEAIARGARAIVSEMSPPPGGEWDALAQGSAAPAAVKIPPEIAWIRVADARKALAIIAGNFFGQPSDKLRLVGITGTNGKTTTSFLIDAILHAAGYQTGLFGTIEHRTPLARHAAATTTPESLELQSFLAEVVQAGGTHAVLEVSSHALALDRAWGCRFGAAVFTNLTRDHLDFHGTLNSYFAAKRRLFEGTGAGVAAVGVVNIDDPYGKQLSGLAERTITYGLVASAQVTTKKFALAFAGLEFSADTPIGRVDVRSSLVGRANVYNLLAAVATCVGLGLARAAIETGIRNLAAVPGRFERIDSGQPFLVIVDYAHTDDALRNLLATARELNPAGRIITMFGCGGDRDRAKRPMMGEAAGRLSDVVVLTSDNPRSEDPRLIINDALVGLQRTSARVLIEPDRERAIELAFDQARPGDIVLLAGKGHETTQVFKDRSITLDDREVARRLLTHRGFGARE